MLSEAKSVSSVQSVGYRCLDKLDMTIYEITRNYLRLRHRGVNINSTRAIMVSKFSS